MISAFTAALMIARELTSSDGDSLFGMPPLVPVLGGALLLGLGALGVGVGLRFRAPDAASPAPPLDPQPGAAVDTTDVMPANLVADRLRALKELQAAGIAVAANAPVSPAIAPNASWRARLTEAAADTGSSRVRPTMQRIRPHQTLPENPD